MSLVVVDAENVRRSVWPNMTREELVERARAWAAREGHELRIVFEGERTADEEIADLAASLDEPFWLVTSDRELRASAGGRAERVLGGGSFARTI